MIRVRSKVQNVKFVTWFSTSLTGQLELDKMLVGTEVTNL